MKDWLGEHAIKLYLKAIGTKVLQLPVLKVIRRVVLHKGRHIAVEHRSYKPLHLEIHSTTKATQFGSLAAEHNDDSSVSCVLP